MLCFDGRVYSTLFAFVVYTYRAVLCEHGLLFVYCISVFIFCMCIYVSCSCSIHVVLYFVRLVVNCSYSLYVSRELVLLLCSNEVVDLISFSFLCTSNHFVVFVTFLLIFVNYTRLVPHTSTLVTFLENYYLT